MEANILYYPAKNPSFDQIKFIGFKVILVWLWKTVTLQLLWKKLLLRFFFAPLAELCFVWVPQFIKCACELFGELLVAGIFACVLVTLLWFGVPFAMNAW